MMLVKDRPGVAPPAAGPAAASATLLSDLACLARIFDLDHLLLRPVSPADVRAYYTHAAWVYRLLHSPHGAVHLALSPDGRYRPDDLAAQAGLVRQWLWADGRRPREVLELASGMGYNVRLLAATAPETRFVGVDLTPLHVRLARRMSRRLPNAHFVLGDFHHLRLADQSGDGAFAVECLCHAADLGRALGEACRVLRPGGRLVVTDGFREPGFRACPPALQRAARLVERSMAVERFWRIDGFVRTAEEVGLRVLAVEDKGPAIAPNLRRLRRWAGLYVRWPGLAGRLTRVLPDALSRHVVTGMLGLDTLLAGAQGYYLVVLERPGGSG